MSWVNEANWFEVEVAAVIIAFSLIMLIEYVVFTRI